MAISIHPTAIVDPRAELAEDVEIGPYAIIEGDVHIGRGTHVHHGGAGHSRNCAANTGKAHGS